MTVSGSRGPKNIKSHINSVIGTLPQYGQSILSLWCQGFDYTSFVPNCCAVLCGESMFSSRVGNTQGGNRQVAATCLCDKSLRVYCFQASRCGTNHCNNLPPVTRCFASLLRKFLSLQPVARGRRERQKSVAATHVPLS